MAGEPMLQATMPGDGAALPTDLNAALLSTVAYSDVFGFTPTTAEIHRYLHGVTAGRDDVAAALDQLVAMGQMEQQGGAFALTGRAHLFPERVRREAIAGDLWQDARRYARWLSSFPTVRMVGVTGSLAVGNTLPGADVDFMIVVEAGSVWRTRAACLALQHANQFFGGVLCANYFRSEKALTLDDQGLYLAHELAQMVPLYGEDVYKDLRAANRWTERYLPNAIGPPRETPEVKPQRLVRSALWPIVKSPIGRYIEHREQKRKIQRYNDTDFLPGRNSTYSSEGTGHRLHIMDTIENCHQQRLADDAARRHRVLFGQAYHLRFDPKLWKEMRPYPPLGSLYAASIARNCGYDVSFFDSMLSVDAGAWQSALDRHQPDIAVLYEDNFNYLTKMCLSKMREAALQMIEAARTSGAMVVICGSDASDHPEIYLNAGADFVIRGEGEGPLEQFLTAHAEGRPVEDLPSLSYLHGDGIKDNPRQRPIAKLDEVPFPAWDLVQLAKYRNIWQKKHRRFSLNLVTTRGCPYHCNWCAKPIWGQRYNVRSPQNVAAELAEISEVIKPDHVWFMDDIFGLKPKWVARFADELEARQVKIRFKCLTRPDLLNRPGEIDAMARAGCETVWIGAESGSQKILDAMEKGTKVEDIERITGALRDRDINVGYFVQFGYPGESVEDINATRRMVRRSLPDELGISVSYPLPGTKFHDRVQNQLGAVTNWRDSDDLAMLFKSPYSTEFYRLLHRLLHCELAWFRTVHLVRSGKLFRRPILRQIKALAYFAFNSVRLPVLLFRFWMGQRASNDALDDLPYDLSAEDAAKPSPQ